MTAHIVVDDANPGALFCRHCSDLYAPDLPISIERYLNACRGFVLMHKLCPKPEEPTRQLPLPHTQDHTKTAKDRAPGRSREEPAGGSAPTSEEPNGGAEEAKEQCGECGSWLQKADGQLWCTNCDEPRSLERAGIDGSTDEPAPEIDPPGPDAFAARYPMATDHGKLRGDLAVVLGNRGLRVPSLDELRQWHEASGVFDAIAHWARLEIAHMNAKEHPEIQIPGRLDMPEKLAELIGERPKKRRSRAPKETTT